MKSKSLLLILGLVFIGSSVLVAQDYQYVGVAKCKICHNKPATGQQYKIWSESLHAKAMETLKNEKSMAYAKEHNIADPSKDASCIKCHATAGSIKDSENGGIKMEEGVSCESCHGPGSAYKSISVMKNREEAMKKGMIIPDQKVCEKCHNKDNPFYKPFNFEEKKALIAHPDPMIKK